MEFDPFGLGPPRTELSAQLADSVSLIITALNQIKLSCRVNDVTDVSSHKRLRFAIWARPAPALLSRLLAQESAHREQAAAGY